MSCGATPTDLLVADLFHVADEHFVELLVNKPC